MDGKKTEAFTVKVSDDMTPNEQARYRANTKKVAAMYGHRFLCRKCGQSCAPAGRKKANGEGWICAGCVGNKKGKP